MSFFDRFESTKDGIDDTVEFTIRMAVVTLACVILVVIIAMVAGLFVSDSVINNDKIFEIIGPAFNTVVGAFVGLLGGLSLNANARDKEEPIDPETSPEPPVAVVEMVEDDEDEDDMAPWEKYRNDLRYDHNHDGIVDENDFPDWRNAGR